MSNDNQPTLKHLGIICDGNRRWAREHGLPTFEGHRRGFKAVEMVIDALKDSEVEYVSFYLFSTENWDRSEEEVSYLMQLLSERVDELTKKAQSENLCLKILGREEPMDPVLWQKMQHAEVVTKNNSGLTVCLCLNYGGRWEIADAIKQIIASDEKDCTPEKVAKFLYHPEVPDCDLIVRTSGEQRLSGFQLWRAAYAEFLFVEKKFPALEKTDIWDMIKIFHQRQRRFGK